MKKKVINLMDFRNVPQIGRINRKIEKSFKILSLSNSIEYVVGDMLDAIDVQILCKNQEWTVNIKPYG